MSEIAKETAKIISESSTGVTYGTVGGAGFGMLTYNQTLMTISVLIGAVSAVINFYYRKKMLEEARKKNEA